MSDIDDIALVYLNESQELIETIRDILANYLQATDKKSEMNQLWRCIHTIKGGAGTVGLHRLKDEAHALENELTQYQGQPENLKQPEIQKLIRNIDQLEDLLEQGFDPQNQASAAAEPNHAFGFFDESETNQPPTQEAAEPPAQPYQQQSQQQQSQQQSQRAKTNRQDMLRVPLERVQRNFEIISEIFLIRNQLKYSVEKLRQGEANTDTFIAEWESLDNSLRKSIGELEYLAMTLRMTPIKGLMQRMERTVRGYADQAGKQIQVLIRGEETELDKKILDSLGEPLIHLIRNAMDHGIEPPIERQKLGKPEQATITIAASVEGNEVVVEVSDDGRGIDGDKILAAANRKGVDTSRVRTKNEAVHLIFHPGFSTKDQATDISGRGVGMDSVKSYVEELGGTIEIDTEVNRGTTFRLHLSLGLSLIPVLIAKANGIKFAIATSDVFELHTDDINQVSCNGNQRFYHHRGQFIPCYPIDEVLFCNQADQQRVLARRRSSFCLIKAGQDIAAMQVQEILGTAEIAVKALPPNAGKCPFASGVSILPTGEPTFVISLSRIYDELKRTSPAVSNC
jgi:two-component system chemotaxis sensor kinase CheA